MKKIIYTLLIVCLLSVFSLHFYNSQKELATYSSPDGKYILIIKVKSLDREAMPGGGGAESASVEVILRNSNGKIIGKSSSNSDCGTLYDSIEVEWNIKEGYVSYGRAKYIDLKTGKVDC